MKKNLVLFAILLLSINFSLHAAKVEVQDARRVAQNLYFEQFNRHDAILYDAINITGEYVETVNTVPVYYIFNINDKGFVIVTADDANYPIIGFSFESTYSPSDQAEGFSYWMNSRKEEIAYNIQNNILPDANITNEWQRLLTKDPTTLLPKNKKSVLDVSPMLTSLWDQTFPYNVMCPADPSCSSFNGHVTVGCIATAMVQIMYYWRWPNQGQNSHCDTYHNYGTLCADFGSTTYDWTGMNDQPSKECDPIALISYHAGISVNMNYNDDGQCSSGAYTSDVPNALKNYFRYGSSCMYAQKMSYSTSNWNNLLQGDLNIGEPVLYAGRGPGGGHAWVCDGYQATDYYHFNFGWSGQSNGYYYLTNINPGGYTFNQSQEAAVHIAPDAAQYPTYCTGQSNLDTYTFGTIEDGSGPLADYQNNANCSWLIEPNDSISSISISFERFNTDVADVLTIYDGPTTSATVLGTFSGSTMPTQTITSTGPQVLITFTSNSSVTAQGFLLKYTANLVNFCNANTSLTDASGSFSDGSGRFDYRNSANCKWNITPPNAVSVTVTFSNFNTETTNDFVKILDMVSSTPLAVYSGDHTSSPLQPVTSTTGKMMIMWISNKTIQGSGWDATYSSLVGVGDVKAFDDLSVFPNPTDGILNVHFTMNESQTVRIEVVSLTGETVYHQTIDNFKGTFDKSIDLSSLSKGVYMLRLINDKGITNNKIVLR